MFFILEELNMTKKTSNHRSNMLRSSFGGHFAGTGIVQEADMLDDYVIKRSIKKRKGYMFETDKFGNSTAGKELFDEYCKQQSGEVISYSLNDLENASSL